MSEIILTDPIASHNDLDRLHLFPGRHLGEQEFERIQAYTDRRISPLLTGRDPGIFHGLNVRTGNIGHLGEGFTVNPGLALAGNGLLLGLFYPLRQTWQTLVDDYLADLTTSNATGIFYLTLKRATRYIDADPSVDPCQRAEFDPTRDARRVLVGTLGLTRLALDESAVSSLSREEIENWVAANNVERELLLNMTDAVPLGLLAITRIGSELDADYQVSWFSQETGRYMAVANGGYQVLLNQVNEAFRRKMLEANDLMSEGETLVEYLSNNLRMNYLPAAGELPKELIQNIASVNPSVAWLPNHLYVDMVAVPEESVNELINRHLPRRAIDLSRPARDRIRLLIAVNEPDYSPSLLKFPQTDAQLQDDIYRYSMRSYKIWAEWINAFNHLYFETDSDVLSEKELKSLDLPEPITRPIIPQDFFAQTIDEALAELGEGEPPTAPYPYNQGVPEVPIFYQNWGVEDQSLPGEPIMPPPIVNPTEDGLVIKITVAQHELEAIDNQIRAIRGRLEKTRDYLLLQRQQLDNQTVSLAALAGGVAGDGSGLQVARWLPFTQLKAPEIAAGGGEENGGEEGGGEEGGSETGEGTEPPAPLTNFRFFESSIPSAFVLSQAKFKPKEISSGSAFSINKSIFSNTLRKTPSILSNVQLSLNQSLLNKIAEAPKAALTRPAFEAKEFRFGVLSHIRPEIQEYKKIVRGMSELITTLADLYDPMEAAAIKKSLRKFGSPTPLSDLGLDNSNVESTDELTSKIYEAMFNAGKILTKQIAFIEGRYARVEALLEGKLRSRINKEAQIEKLAALIGKATEKLENIDKRRVEYLGDYGVAQRLLDEDWLAIYNENLERTRILTTAVLGVYYVRERQTPISLPLADPLELRYGNASDIVPGCDWESDPELPEELDDFFDTVTEIPMADWASLKDLTSYIPTKPRLEFISNIRKTRILAKQNRSRNRIFRRTSFNLSLANVQLQSQSVLTHMSRYVFPLAISSIQQRQKEASQVMSLDDIISGTRGRLKNQAQTLNKRLEQGIYCLLDKLSEVAPSVRLQWAQLAEDDRLNIERVALWPGLERAEREDFNATRTIAELVAWWFRQIDEKASSNGRGAMRNMVRATLIHAALGDPTEILQGQVQVPPRRLAIGETLRLKLNRSAKPGTRLQLMDASQKVVALLNIEDDDDKGVVAKVSQVSIKNVSVTTQYRVVASKLTRFLR